MPKLPLTACIQGSRSDHRADAPTAIGLSSRDRLNPGHAMSLIHKGGAYGLPTDTRKETHNTRGITASRFNEHDIVNQLRTDTKGKSARPNPFSEGFGALYGADLQVRGPFHIGNPVERNGHHRHSTQIYGSPLEQLNRDTRRTVRSQPPHPRHASQGADRLSESLAKTVVAPQPEHPVELRKHKPAAVVGEIAVGAACFSPAEPVIPTIGQLGLKIIDLLHGHGWTTSKASWLFHPEERYRNPAGPLPTAPVRDTDQQGPETTHYRPASDIPATHTPASTKAGRSHPIGVAPILSSDHEPVLGSISSTDGRTWLPKPPPQWL